MGLIKKRIQEIQNDMKNKDQTKIIESFLKRSDTSCNPSICPDIIHLSSVRCDQYIDLKLKGGGTDNLKVKRFTSDNNNVNLALNALRSSSLLNIYSEHKKCAAKTFCNFCLLRSIVFKINSSKGRQSLQPIEVEGQLNNCDNLSVIEILNRFIINSTQSVSSFLNAINPVWTCSCCRKENSNTDGSIIFLDNDAKNREISNLLKLKYCSLKEKHIETALTEFVFHSQNFDLNLQNDQKSCAFHSSENIEVDLQEIHAFGGKV